MTRTMARALLLATVLLLGVTAAEAQVRRPAAPDWRIHQAGGVGWMGSAPHALLGAMAWVVTPRAGGTGLFIDARLTHRSYEDDSLFEPNITSEQAQSEFGDFYVRSVESWKSAHLGLVRPLSPDFALYAGAGWADGTIYDEYIDETQTRGDVGGSYRTISTTDSGGRVSFTGGAIFRFGRALAFHFGLESAPKGFTTGASLVFQ